jgi:methionine-rich copper-binding protein CopC
MNHLDGDSSNSWRQIVIYLTLLLPCTVIAHTGIATTVPDHDAVMERAPTLLRFSFPGEVTITNARILPINEQGMQTGDTLIIRLPRNRIGQSTAFGQNIELEAPPLDPGIYQVVFQVTSIEGHTMADDFVFTVTGELSP